MRGKILVVVSLMLIGLRLFAQQEAIYPKGKFDVFPLLEHRQSTMEQKVGERDWHTWWTNTCETETDWVLNGCWDIGIPTLGPDSVPQGVSCLATSLNSLYPNDVSIQASTGFIDLPFANKIVLNFSEYFELESNWDFGYVLVSLDNNLYSLDSRTGTSDNQWRDTELNLTRFQGRNIKLVFSLESDSSVPAAGWYIDDLILTYEEPLPMELSVSDINYSYYPSVYLTASVNSPDGMVTDLAPQHFSATENGANQQDMFTVVCPDNDEDLSAVDIVFVLDVTGSMGDEINAVRANMLSFMQQLQNNNVDYRIGFVVFGDIVYVYNQYSFYTQFTQIMGIIENISLGEHGIGSGGDMPENQLEAMAEGSLFMWRPGASKVMIMLTDADAHESDSVTQWTVGNLLAQRLLPNNVVVFPIFNINHQQSMSQYYPIAEHTNPGAIYYHIYDNFDAIIDNIGGFISSMYSVHYISSVPYSDPITRMVNLQVQRSGISSNVNAFYIPGISPTIRRSTSLQALDSSPVNYMSNVNIQVSLEDRLAPDIEEKKLYWRHTGTENFQTIDFSEAPNEPGVFNAVIPANQVNENGIEYYILASDGQSTNTFPASDPSSQPLCIAISPNQHTSFVSVNSQYDPGTAFSVVANCTSTPNVQIWLYYRPMGSLVYKYVLMAGAGGNSYEASISEDLGDLGVQYYLVAEQNNGINTFYGIADEPHLELANTTYQTEHPAENLFSDLRVYPNPISLETTDMVNLQFELKEDLSVALDIFNVKGQKVRSIKRHNLSKGPRTISWDGRDSHKQKVSSGIYLYRLTGRDKAVTGKLLISK